MILEEYANRYHGAGSKTSKNALDLSVAAEDKLPEVARIVLDPAGDLSGKCLVVVGDGVFHYVPFAALPEAAAGGTPHDAAELKLSADLAVLSGC